MNAFILQTIAAGGYLGVFLLMALENIVPPVPSEIIMGYSGVLVARGEFAFWPLLFIGTCGTVAGNFFWYWLGRRWTEAQLQGFVERHGRWLTFEWRQFQKARKLFRRNGELIVFVLRFSPVLRTIISLPAGLAKMNVWRFSLFTFLGSLIWNGLLIAGGSAASGLLDRYDTIVGWSVAALLIFGVGWYLWRVLTWQPSDRGD